MRINWLFLIAICNSIVIGCVCNETSYQGGKKMAGIISKEAAPLSKAAPLAKVLLVIASNNFRDEEFLQPKQVIEAKEYIVTVASSSLHVSKGVLGATVTPDILLSEANKGSKL